nr:MAG TPA: hypothetical protein [Bacteriophage sp.]
MFERFVQLHYAKSKLWKMHNTKSRLYARDCAK